MEKKFLISSNIELGDSRIIGQVGAEQYVQMAGDILKSMLHQSGGLTDEEDRKIYFPSRTNSPSRTLSYSEIVDAADELTYQLFLKVHHRTLKK